MNAKQAMVNDFHNKFDVAEEPSAFIINFNDYLQYEDFKHSTLAEALKDEVLQLNVSYADSFEEAEDYPSIILQELTDSATTIYAVIVNG